MHGTVCLNAVVGLGAVATDEAASLLLSARLLGIVHVLVFVACRYDDDVPGSLQPAQYFGKQLVVFVLRYSIALAEGDDTGLSPLVGTVEEVLESQGVGSRGVFVVVAGVDEDRIAGDGIADQADVAVKGYSAIGRGIAAAGNDA